MICKKCHKKFKTSLWHLKHEKTCPGNQGVMKQCLKCEKYIPTKTFKKHYTFCMKYLCDQCPLTFSNKTTFLIHQRKKHKKILPKLNKNKQPLTCTACGQTFKGQRTLKRHEKDNQHEPKATSSAAEANKTQCKCRTCGGTFPDRKSLYAHRVTTHQIGGGAAATARTMGPQ